MSENENKNINQQRLTSFTKAINTMVATNEASYNIGRYNLFKYERRRDYTREEIDRIIEHGSTESQILLSRAYFSRGGFYQRLLLHYATLLKYIGILIPNPSFGKNLSESYIVKKYYNATNFLDTIHLPELFTHFSEKALKDGCYYGVIHKITNTSLSIIDLPTMYCRTRFKDDIGNDIIEFDVTYFDSIFNEDYRKQALKTYPTEISNWYRRYKNNKVKNKWCVVSPELSICLPFLDGGAPAFLNIIPASLEYEEAKDINRERDLEEIRKLIVQKIPHLSDGGLLFEPEEAEIMHKGTVDMTKGNSNLSVLTTYADVEAVVSKTSNDNSTTSIDKSLNNIYAEAGSSSQLFGTDSNLSLSTSINNDMALMMSFAHKLGRVMTFILNNRFGNSNIQFTYKILPITHYNSDDYIDRSLKMANSGYSFILPALAMDISQKELNDLKILENDVLKLKDKLIPLSTSYTETQNVGRPKKDAQDKSAKTVANEESLDSGGSNNE